MLIWGRTPNRGGCSVWGGGPMCRGACAGTHRMPRLRRQECVECTNEIGRGWCVKAVPRSPARPHSVTLIDWAASPSGSGGNLAHRPVAVDVDARRTLVALGQVGGRRLWPVLLVRHQQALDEGDLPAAREGKGVSSARPVPPVPAEAWDAGGATQLSRPNGAPRPLRAAAAPSAARLRRSAAAPVRR